MTRTVVIALAAAVLCGCFGKEEEIVPAELVDFDASLDVRRAWSASLGKVKDELYLGLAPNTNGARVFAASHGGVVAAFDAQSGRPDWRVETELPLSGGPGIGANGVALGSSEGDLIMLAIEDGSELWRVNVGSEVLSSPALGGGIVCVRTVDGRLLGLDAADGSERWVVTHPVEGLTLRGTAAPVISGDVVISGFDNGRISAVRLADGELLWETTLTEQRGRTALDRLADVDARVAVVNEDVFVAGYQGSTALLSLVTGSAVWRQEISSHNTPALDWNRLYITASSDAVLAMRRSSGVAEWSQPRLENRRVTGPAVSSQAVVVGDFEGYLHWLDIESGEFIARTRAGSGAVTTAPLVVGDMVFVQTARGELTAWRLPEVGGG